MKRRSGIKVMGQLIGLVVPLLHVMLAAIFLGVAGFLCAIFLTILAGTALMYFDMPVIVNIHIKILIAFAVLRGILHYACLLYTSASLTVLISRLRSKICAATEGISCIHTRKGKGYYLE